MKKIATVLLVIVCVAFWGNICLAQELTDSQTHSKPVAVGDTPLLAPYQAYGVIFNDGTIEWGKNIVSVTWDSSHNRWQIALNGVDFFYLNFVTLVSSYTGYHASYDSISGNLLVTVYDKNGNAVKKGFSFRVER